MSLPSDSLVLKATTLTSNVQSIIPQVWAPRLETNLRRRDVFSPSMVVNTELLAPNAGDTVYIPILPDIQAAAALTEGTDMTMIALNNAQTIPLVPTEYGLGVEITRKALDRMKYDGMAEIVDRLGYSMSLLMQGQMANLWNQVVPGTASKALSLYPNGHTSASVVAGDIFSDNLLLQAVQQLEQNNNVPFDDGYYRLYLSPSQWVELLQDQKVREDIKWSQAGNGNANPMLSGYGALANERGILHGCRIIVTNYIPTATENSITVQKAMLMAPRFAAIAYKRLPEIIVDPTLYDFGRRRRFGVVADYAIQPIHAERCVVITTA